MFDTVKEQIEWGGGTLTLEAGKVARQASASIVANMGESVFLCTVVGEKESAVDAGFLPLTVHYQEKFYASGRIPGGFIKRVNNPNERELLVYRLIETYQAFVS